MAEAGAQFGGTLNGPEAFGMQFGTAMIFQHQSDPELTRRTDGGFEESRRCPEPPGHRVGPCFFCVRDQPVDLPPLDLVGRPRSLIFQAVSRAGARTRYRRGSVGAFTLRCVPCARYSILCALVFVFVIGVIDHVEAMSKGIIAATESCSSC